MSDRVAAAIEVVRDGTGSVREVCDVLEIPRSTFYALRAARKTARSERTRELAPKVAEIFRRHRRRYGTRRIRAELADGGLLASRRKVAEILKSQGMKAIQPKSFQPKTTASRHRLGYSPNLLLEDFEPTGLDQLWVADITYIPLRGRQFTYLSLLMDRHSRRLIGWELDATMTEHLVLRTLKRAIAARDLSSSLIFHSDRGGQYAGKEFRSVLRRASIRQSMSRAGDCYDNAFMESCFGTIKTELQMTEYETRAAADREIIDYLAYYNRDRKHSAIDYLTPIQFEARITRRK